MSRKTYVWGLITALILFYLPLMLALRSASGMKTLIVAPFVAAIEGIQDIDLSHPASLVTIGIQLVLLALISVPFCRKYPPHKMLGLGLIGWLSSIVLLLWSFKAISAGA